MKKILLVLAVSSTLMIGCKESPKQECKKTGSCCHHKKERLSSDDNAFIAVLKTEIMVLHDEVMPKDPYLRNLRSKLEASNDSVESILDSVVYAQKEMHEWMVNYKSSHDNTDTAYFNNELLKVTKVNELYKVVIPSAERAVQ